MLLEDILKVSELFPNEVAIISDNERITYKELISYAKRIANKLNKLGVKKGDYITIEIARGYKYVAAMLASWMVNSAFAALDNNYPIDRLDYIASDCHAKARINDSFFFDLGNDEIDEINYPNAFDSSLLVYTSGSTGKPKGVLHSHQSMLDASIRVAKVCDGLEFKRRGDIFGHPIPFSFVAGLCVLYGTMLSAMTSYIVPYNVVRDPKLMSDTVYKNNISIAYIPPKMLHVFENKNNTLKFVFTGSEKVTNLYRDDFVIINGYGSSETGGAVTFFKIDKKYDNTPIGKPVLNEKVYILDENGKEAIEGEMCIAGNFSLGYLNLEEETKTHFIPNPFKDKDGFDVLYKTGDIAKKLDDGNFLYVNRKDWMIKINGQRVEPGEIEGTVRGIDGILDCAVKDFIGKAKQTCIALYYVLKPNSNINVDDIKKVINNKLPSYMMPSYFMKLDKLPLNANGKLDRKALPNIDITSKIEYVAPKTKVERELANAFQKALNIPSIGIKDDFFDLGGDSISVMILVEACQNLNLSTKMIYENRTIENIAKALKANKNDVIDIDYKNGEFPLNQAQLGIFLESDRREGEIAYNNPILLKFSKDIDEDKLKNAIEKTVLNHPGLLTTIKLDDNNLPVMKYNKEFENNICDLRYVTEDVFKEIKNGLIKPFLIKKDRLFRFRLFRTKDNLYLFMDIHHIIFDGGSMRIMMPEISNNYYGKEVKGEDFTAYHYGLYEENERKKESYEIAKKWYLGEFSDIEEVSIPQGDKKDNETKFSELKVNLDIDIDKLKDFCILNQLTLNAVTTAAFGYLLSIYTMNKKAAFSTVYNGRHDIRVANTVSMFVRTLPVLCKIEKDIDTIDYIRNVKDQMMKSMVNDIYSFRELASHSGYTSDVLFTYQGDLFEIFNMNLLKCQQENLAFNATGEKLSCQLFPLNNKLVLDIQYHGNIYSEKWIIDFSKRYEKILNDFLNITKLSDVKLVTKEEEKEIIKISKGIDLDFNKDETFVDLFLNSVKATPNKRAIVAKNGEYTYKELDIYSNIIANYLKEKGIKNRDFVALKMSRIKEFVPAIIGIQKSGAAYIPIDPAYPNDRIEYMVEDSKAKLILDDSSIIDILNKHKNIKAINNSKPKDPAYMIYTSGSTGKPKGVVISNLSLRSLIAWRVKQFNLNKDTVSGLHASFSFDASIVDLFPHFTVSGELHILSEEYRMDLDLIYNYINENKIIGITMSTQIGMSLLNTHPDVKLKYISLGGEKFLPVAKTNVNIYNEYGPTEFTVASSFHLVDQAKDIDVPIGRAVPNSYSFICDINGNLLPLGMKGELCLSGLQMSDGYFEREELNKERFVDTKFLPGAKMYRTGDLANYNSNNELEYVGRIDFQVKLRGFRIELGEIENVASLYDGIKQVIALVKNKLLVLYYTKDKKINESKLKDFMKERLTDYMVPSIFVELDTMPLNPSGKIDRRALPDVKRVTKDIVSPRNDIEEAIYDLLLSIIGYSEFGVLDDFNDVGLTSLSAMQLSSLLSTKVNKPIKVSDLVKYNTIEKLANFINKNDNESIDYEILKDYPLTMAQRGILTECLAHPNTTIYNVPTLITLPSELDIDKLIVSIEKAIDAHPYLKCRIISANGDFRVLRNDDSKINIHIMNLDDISNIESLVKPFDILNDELVRCYILIGEKENKFLFDAHHIIFDGESLDSIMNDIDEIYKGNEIEKEKYSEFELALDEERLHNKEGYNDAKAYYDRLLEGRDTDCLLVNDINESNNKKGDISIDIKIDKDKLNSFIKDNKVTINGLWISSIGLALAKFLNRNDAIFTTVYNGRNDARIRNAVGMFVHTLPIVCEPYKYIDSISYVKDMGVQIQKNMAYDIYSFMEIAHDLNVRADIMFVYEGLISQGYKIGGYDVKNVELLALNEIKASILIAISDTLNGFNIHVEYDGNKYQKWSIESFINATIKSFELILENKNLNNVNLLSQNDKLVIKKSNDTNVDFKYSDIVSEFKDSVKKYPNNFAIIYKDKKYTYKELDELSDRIASYLASEGVKRGNVVSILVSRNPNMVISALGVLKTGAAYQPLDHSYPTDRLEYMINDANAKYLIVEDELIEKIPNIKLPILYTSKFDSLKDLNIKLDNPKYDDLFILLYTSGTTGKPKGVMLSHLNLVNFCHWYRRYYNLNEKSIHSAYAGFGFDACMMDLYPALTTGSAICIVPDELRMNLDMLEKYFEDNKVTHSFMTTQVGRLFASLNDKSSLNHLSVGGEKLTPLAPPSGYNLYNGYGPTECTIFSTIKMVDKLYFRIPIGAPLDNYKLYVVDDKFNEVPLGALGELWISGLGVGMGYLNLKERTEASFIKNPFSTELGYERVYRTGDIVRRLEDGSIDFIGRNDGQVKIRGFRIELGEVENIFREFEGIKDVTVQAFDLDGGGKFLGAYFVSDKKIDIEALKEFIKENKPAYMVPASIMQIDSIPLNQNQKVNKKALPKPIFKAENKEFIEPKNDIEKDFVNAYSEILGIDKVSANESFFNLGGTSLTAAKVVVFALNKGYQITYQDIFQYPSPIELAEFILNNNKNENDEDIEINDDTLREALKYNDVKYVDEIKIERELGTVLLTGANGFLGIHIFKELLDNKINTIIVVRSKEVSSVERIKGLLMYYFDSALDQEFDKYVKVIDADIIDNNLEEKLKNYQFDTIINSAAIVKHFASDDSIERVNVGGVKNLINIAKNRNARFIQISTLSVAGENVDHKFSDNYLMKENQLYFGQDLSNKYANSKFKAEEAILDAIENDNLDAKIIRVGNLMSRASDGEFQINSVTNAFMRNLRGYKVLGKFPISALDRHVDFSPIDEIAKTIILFSKTPKKFTVFHSLNSHLVQMGDVIDAMNLAGIKIDKVSDVEFGNALKQGLEDKDRSVIVSSLLSYASSDNKSHDFIQSDSTYTVKALYRLGYRWPITDFEYLIKAIESLDTLGFFDRLD